MDRSIALEGAVHADSPHDGRGEDINPKLRGIDMKEGEQRLVQIGGIEALFCRVGGKTHAVDPICPHQGSSLVGGKLRGKTISCPLHGARFDLNTGRALGGANYPPIVVYAIRAGEDGELFLQSNEAPA